MRAGGCAFNRRYHVAMFSELRFIADVLDSIAPLVRQRYEQRASLQIEQKSEAADLVTAADIEVQQHIQRAIAAAYPDDRMVGEEAGGDEPPTDPTQRCWVLDPIDGTHNFARGMMPAFGVSLAAVVNSQPIAGGVSLPMLDKLFLASRDDEATCNGRAIAVSQVDDLAAARVEIDFCRPTVREPIVHMARRVMLVAGQLRCNGSAVTGLCALACGDNDAYLHATLMPWDFAAAMLIVQQAGGTVTRPDNTPVGVFDGRLGMIASNGRLHEQLLALTR